MVKSSGRVRRAWPASRRAILVVARDGEAGHGLSVATVLHATDQPIELRDAFGLVEGFGEPAYEIAHPIEIDRSPVRRQETLDVGAVAIPPRNDLVDHLRPPGPPRPLQGAEPHPGPGSRRGTSPPPRTGARPG